MRSMAAMLGVPTPKKPSFKLTCHFGRQHASQRNQRNVWHSEFANLDQYRQLHKPRSSWNDLQLRQTRSKIPHADNARVDAAGMISATGQLNQQIKKCDAKPFAAEK
jgi:hypothetical protein